MKIENNQEQIQKNESPDLKESRHTEGGPTPPQGTPQEGGQQNNFKGPNIFNIMLVIFVITFLINTLFLNNLKKNVQMEIPYSQFIQLVESGNIELVELGDEEAAMTISQTADLQEVEQILFPAGRDQNIPAPDSGIILTAIRAADQQLIDRLTENEVTFGQVQTQTGPSPLVNFLTFWVLPIVLMYLFYSFVIRNAAKKMGGAQGTGGGLFGIGKSKATEYNVEKHVEV